MKICSPQLGLNPNSTLGGEVYDREILLGLARSGLEIEIILPKNLPHDRNIKNWHITYLTIRHFPALLFNILVVPYLFSVYLKTKFDVIRLHSPMFMGIGTLVFKVFNPHVKTIATFHQFRETNIYFLGKIINKIWDHVITDSEYVRNKIIREYKIDPSKITAIHNGVPNYLIPQKKNKSLLKKYRLEHKTILLFMGLFEGRKNPLFLIDVLSALKRKDVVLIFWGAGPLKDQIIEKSKRKAVSHQIRIISPVFGPAKTKIHNLADIFVHPAIDEGFALAPLEAMACAKPIVMTNAFSAREQISENYNGFLCNLNNINDWTNKISLLISDKNLREKMGIAAKNLALKKFVWKKAIGKHLEILGNFS